jgi:hypothetical protein
MTDSTADGLGDRLGGQQGALLMATWTEAALLAGEGDEHLVTVDNPVDTDLVGHATERTLNWTWYVGNRLNLDGGLSMHLNAEFWNTEFLTLSDGDAMRLKTVLIPRF